MTKRLKVRLTLKEEMLGTSSSDPEIHETFIASKAPQPELTEEEVASIEEMEASPETVFPRDDEGRAFMWDYQVKGFFKDACSMLHRCTGTKSARLAAFRKVIDGLVFIQERKIPLVQEDQISSCQRPLRAQTARGERICLAHSETVPAGTTLEFEIVCMDMKPLKGTKPKDGKKGEKTVGLIELVQEWLDYGEFRGLGQWRNSGKGAFTWEEVR